jgi:hypothetical protein
MAPYIGSSNGEFLLSNPSYKEQIRPLAMTHMFHKGASGQLVVASYGARHEPADVQPQLVGAKRWNHSE